MARIAATLLTLLLAPASAPAIAQEPPSAVARHAIAFGTRTIRYSAAFERFVVTAPGSPAAATITTIAYIHDRPDPRRPIVFAFNGGPGSSSLILNVGLLGPRRIDLPADPKAPIRARLPLVANDDTVLDVADIVFIDPVGTGFSRLIDPKAGDYLYSVRGDAQAVAEAIGAWTRAHGRGASPKYVLGESYGALRAVLVAQAMRKAPDTADVAGVVLVSQSLQIIDTVQRRSNIVGQVAGLQTMAATARYHGLAGRGTSLEAFGAEAAAFAREIWLPALMAGTALDAAARRRVAEGLSRYTGLAPAYFLDNQLVLTKETYRRVALAGDGLMLGLYDSRYAGPAGGKNPDDRLLDAITSSGPAMWQEAVGVDTARYPPAGTDTLRTIGRAWRYIEAPIVPTAGMSFRQFDYVADLLALMADAPRLRCMVAGGWYDTTASVGGDDYLLSRPGLDRDRITTARYPAGHVFYTDPASRSAFAALLRDFLGRRAQ